MNCMVSKGSIYYKTKGEGFPLVILHSMGTDHRSMMAWLEPVFDGKKGFQRIYIDMPAHGYSTITDELKSSDDMIFNILECLDSLLPEQAFALIGTSFGGFLAQGLLHRRPKQVKGICLLVPNIQKKDRKMPQKVVFNRDDNLLEKLDPDIREAFETLMIFQNKIHLNHFMEEIQPGRLLVNREFLLSNWREKGYFFKEEPFHNMEKLEQPTLILLGKQDSICGYEDHYALLEKFQHATLAVLDQAGHMLQIEKRDVVQSMVKEWLHRLTEFTSA
jgi:pimeloyl-ACP methyl ester carboxylesterase